MQKTRVIKPAIILSVIIFPIIILLSAMFGTVFAKPLYEKQFEANGVYADFAEEYSESYINQVNKELLFYLLPGSKDKIIQNDFFNEKEKTHLQEVKGLLLKFLFVLVTASLLLSVFIKKIFMVTDDKTGERKQALINITLYGSIVTIGVAGFFALLSTKFEYIFLRFHEIFFKSNTWLLDPATDNLIRLFPERFFQFMFGRIIAAAIVISAVIIILVIYDKSRGKTKKDFRS